MSVRAHISETPNFLRMWLWLGSSAGAAIRYVLPVLWTAIGDMFAHNGQEWSTRKRLMLIVTQQRAAGLNA